MVSKKKKEYEGMCVTSGNWATEEKKMSFSGEKMDINIANILKGRREEGRLVPEMGRAEMGG